MLFFCEPILLTWTLGQVSRAVSLFLSLSSWNDSADRSFTSSLSSFGHGASSLLYRKFDSSYWVKMNVEEDQLIISQIVLDQLSANQVRNLFFKGSYWQTC